MCYRVDQLILTMHVQLNNLPEIRFAYQKKYCFLSDNFKVCYTQYVLKTLKKMEVQILVFNWVQ